MKRVSNSRFRKCARMRVRVRVWRGEGPGGVVGRVRYRAGWIRRGPRYSTRKTVRQAIWGPGGEVLVWDGGGGGARRWWGRGRGGEKVNRT